MNIDRALNSLEPGMLATDLAHMLVRRGVPFRKAHHLVGTALLRATNLGLDLRNLPYSEYIAIWYGILKFYKFYCKQLKLCRKTTLYLTWIYLIMYSFSPQFINYLIIENTHTGCIRTVLQNPGDCISDCRTDSTKNHIRNS